MSLRKLIHEVVVWKWYVKKCSRIFFFFFERLIGKYLQRSDILGKVSSLDLLLHQKYHSIEGVFLEIERNFWEELIYRTPMELNMQAHINS